MKKGAMITLVALAAAATAIAGTRMYQSAQSASCCDTSTSCDTSTCCPDGSTTGTCTPGCCQ